MRIDIVPYAPEHRARVREICCDTAFGGSPIDPFFNDREMFADMITLYYTDYESEPALTALVDGEVAGYLQGCLDTNRYVREMEITVAPRILWNLLTGSYTIGRHTIVYMTRVIMTLADGSVGLPPLDLYPAHLHMNIDAEYRRLGLGRRLMETYLDNLCRSGSPGVHLGTSSLNTEALPFYESMGFELFRRNIIRNHTFQDVIDEPVHNIIYVKRLIG